MKILANYLYTHWKSLSFLAAFIFFAMDMSDIFGNWGYIAYYPMLFILAYYCFQNKSRVSKVHIAYLGVCLLSIILNPIPAFYQTPIRYATFILLLTSFSSLVNSRKIALMRLHLFHIFSILSMALVTINYIFFSAGFIDKRKMEIFTEHGLFTGSTANNEMGLLAAVAIMFIIAFCGKFYKHLTFTSKLLMLGFLICAISMMAMASSRMGLTCSILSVSFVLYRLNSKNFFKLSFAAVILVAGIYASAYFLGDKFRYMLSKNDNQLEKIDIHSRDDMWQARIAEFTESPVYGVGFAYMKYGWGSKGAKTNRGRIESGSGWFSVLSQTGGLGALCMAIMVIPNILFLIKRRSTSYCSAWYSGMCVMFIMQPITEAYITTVGAVLCCLFWLNYSVIDSFRTGLLREKDLRLLVYKRYNLFDKRLLKRKKQHP